MESDEKLLADYWAAQAQFGPLDVGPEEHLRLVRKAEAETMPEMIDQARAVLADWEREGVYLCDYDAEVAAAKHCPPMFNLLLALLEEHEDAFHAWQAGEIGESHPKAHAALAAFVEACR